MRWAVARRDSIWRVTDGKVRRCSASVAGCGRAGESQQSSG
jgi:hypothetical protein